MSENPIAISNLNDFIFCPVSIYFHSLYYDTEKMTYQNSDQLNGTAVHTTVDSGTYSSKKSMLQSITVYSEKYNLSGKIDLYDSKKFQLIERKKKIQFFSIFSPTTEHLRRNWKWINSLYLT